MRSRRRTAILASLCLAVAATGLGAIVAANAVAASAGCTVSYTVTSQWPGGFGANLDITNLGSPVDGWTLTWVFPANQQVTQGWNGTFTQSGSAVTVTNAPYNASLATGGTTSVGFNGSWDNASNPPPAGFALNGVTCTGSVSPTATASATSSPTRSPTPTASPSVSHTASPTPSSSSTPPVVTGVHGYATVNGSTTGGAGGSTVTVSSLSALQTAAASSATTTILINGLFSGSGNVTVASNKTIQGVGANSGLTGIGLSLKGVSNVIIRNLKISKVTAASGTGDAIHIESGANHIWIDHNDLSSDMSHDKDYYDGLIDITHAADYITVSWNYIHDHWKTSLVGHSDSNGSEDTGHLHVTYDHNYFQNFNSRTPSLRFGTGHVYNNYFVNGDTSVHSRENAQMLVQNNVWRSVNTPIETTGDSDVDGYVNQSGNDFGGGTNQITRTGNFTSPPYSYSLTATSSVVSQVTAGAGTGRI